MRAGLRLTGPACSIRDAGEGRAYGRARSASTESRHLKLGHLTVNALTGFVGQPLEGLPALADDPLIGGHGTLGCHEQRVRLDRHVCGELALALGGAVEADDAVAILVARIACGFRRSVASLSDRAAVKLASTMGGSDIGTSDALEMDLHRKFSEAFSECIGGLDDQLLVEVADAVTIDDGQAEALR